MQWDVLKVCLKGKKRNERVVCEVSKRVKTGIGARIFLKSIAPPLVDSEHSRTVSILVIDPLTYDETTKMRGIAKARFSHDRKMLVVWLSGIVKYEKVFLNFGGGDCHWTEGQMAQYLSWSSRPRSQLSYVCFQHAKSCIFPLFGFPLRDTRLSTESIVLDKDTWGNEENNNIKAVGKQ